MIGYQSHYSSFAKPFGEIGPISFRCWSNGQKTPMKTRTLTSTRARAIARTGEAGYEFVISFGFTAKDEGKVPKGTRGPVTKC